MIKPFIFATLILTAFVCTGQAVRADAMTQSVTVKSPRLVKLAGDLKGRPIVCSAGICSSSSQPIEGMFPVTINFTDLGKSQVKVTVTKTGTDYFGDDLGVETSENWIIISGFGPSGDGRYLTINAGLGGSQFPHDTDHAGATLSFQRGDGVIDLVQGVECALGLSAI